MNSFSFFKLSSVSCEENSIFSSPWDLTVKDFLIKKNENQALLRGSKWYLSKKIDKWTRNSNNFIEFLKFTSLHIISEILSM